MKLLMMIVLCTGIVQGADYQLRKAEITAYCACKKCCGGYADGITASGKRATAGRSLAMPRNIPFGTKVYQVTETGNHYIGTCEDRGGAIKQKGDVMRVDMFYDTHKAALKFGRVKGIILLLILPEMKK